MSNIKVQSARLSYPTLFKATAMQEGQTPKFSCVFLLDKTTHAALITEIKATIKRVSEEKWGVGKVPKGVKTFLRDGAEKADVDGYGEGVMFFSASSKNRPAVVDRDLSPLDGSTGKPYAGSYVNASVRAWAQDNEFGKRINCELRAVQFVKNGTPFGEAPADPTKEFSEVTESEDSDSLME